MERVLKGILSLIFISILIFLFACSHRADQETEPVNDLLGTWHFNGDFLQTGTDTSLLVQINTIQPELQLENTYLAIGCMQTEVSGRWAPLSMQANFDPQTNRFDLNILSTLLDSGLESSAAVIRLIGESNPSSGSAVQDASGLSFTSLGEVAWNGSHDSLQIIDCPAGMDEALTFHGEVGNARDSAYTPPLDTTNFHTETKIAAAKMQVETPDGQIIQVSHFTDIFTPEVNFIDSFRFSEAFAGTPIIEQPYRFSLLDVLGNPIPGASSIDSYIYCDHGAAENLRARFDPNNFLELSWDAPLPVPGQFDPEHGHGFYQIVFEPYPLNTASMSYGAETVLTTHQVPWNPFEPGSESATGGYNYGASLSELEDGDYLVSISAYNDYQPPEGEVGFDCRVTDSRQSLIITKQGNSINFLPTGAVSGTVYDQAGSLLGGIAVEISGATSGFYELVCSQENGFYLFNKLPMDTFTVRAGELGAEGCEPNSFVTLILPDFRLTPEEPILTDMDLNLSP